MHVLLLPSWYPANSSDIGGSFFREQAIALEKAGCEVGVLSINILSLREPVKALKSRFKTQYENDFNVHTYRKQYVNWLPRLEGAQQYIFRSRMMWLFRCYIKKHGKPDIIHVHSMLNAGLAAKEIKKRYGIPYIVTEHSTAYARGVLSKSQLKSAALIAIEASGRFAVSTPFSELLAKVLKQDSSAWSVLPNIVNDSFFKACELQKSKSDKCGFCFLNVSLLVPKKRIDLLITAFSLYFKGRPDVTLRIGGDGKEREALEDLAKRLGVEDQVKFLGMLDREQVVGEMENMDAFVLSSQYETFGVVVTEALAKGKPVIATRCGGPEDIIREQDGILVSPADAEDLAKAMQKIYETIDNYDPNEIRMSCQERYGESAMAERLKSHYQAVIKNKTNKNAGSVSINR